MLDLEREPTPTIPALTRAWRIGCAFTFFLLSFILTNIIIIGYGLAHNLYQIHYGMNPISDLAYNLQSNIWLCTLPQLIPWLIFLFTYDPYSIRIYNWLFSRGSKWKGT